MLVRLSRSVTFTFVGDPRWQPDSPDEPYVYGESRSFTDSVAITRDGKMVATAVNGLGTLLLRDGLSGQVMTDLGKSSLGFGGRVKFSAEGLALFAWNDRHLERWEVQSGRRIRVPAPGRAHFQDLAVHPAGRLLITVSGDGQTRYWDAIDLSLQTAFKWQIGKLHSIVASPDGLLAAAGGDKGQVVVWDIDT